MRGTAESARRRSRTTRGLAAGNVGVMMPILRAWDFDALICHNRFMLNATDDPEATRVQVLG